MKRIGILLIALSLSACASPAPISVKGQVVSCDAVTTDKSIAKGISVECVDGSAGAILESLRGPLIINVWGSWCKSCLDEMPEFVSFYSKAKGKVQLVGVAVEESSPANSRKFIEAHGMTWPNFYDRDNKTRGFFGMGVPVTWFIDESGVVTFKKIGIIKSEEELKTLTAKYLGVKI
jgi:cytochrome c biogenesis protein CcmG, thiol:disulfide interchange protein DsbE